MSGRYLYEHTASAGSQAGGESTPRKLSQPGVEDSRDGGADFEQNSSTPRWGISNEDERLDPLEFDYVAAAELKRVAVPPRPVHEACCLCIIHLSVVTGTTGTYRYLPVLSNAAMPYAICTIGIN